VVRVRSPHAEKLEAALRSAAAAVNRSGDALAIRGPSAAEVGDIAHAQGVAIHELLTEQPGLEELFLQIAGTRREQ
jgi:ABC-2 type transport system ATP-binding protein